MEKYPTQKLMPEWIHSDITEEIAEWAKSFGKDLTESSNGKKPLTTGQIRKFYGEVKRIGASIENNKSDVVMLKPLLAYAVGRDKNNRGENKTKIEDFEKEIRTALTAIRYDQNLASDFKHFEQLFEAIVAYHKFYGGKENNN